MADREKLIEFIVEAMPPCYSDVFACRIADRLISEGVTVRARGRWINPYMNRYGHPCHCCSVCGFKASYQDKNYCPYCGADMR